LTILAANSSFVSFASTLSTRPYAPRPNSSRNVLQVRKPVG